MLLWNFLNSTRMGKKREKAAVSWILSTHDTDLLVESVTLPQRAQIIPLKGLQE